jgi:hypothetical protein
LPDRVGIRTDESARHFRLEVTGALTVADAGRFSIDLDRDMALVGQIDSTHVESSRGASIGVALAPGTHDVALHFSMSGNRWKFVPLWNDRRCIPQCDSDHGRDRAWPIGSRRSLGM